MLAAEEDHDELHNPLGVLLVLDVSPSDPGNQLDASTASRVRSRAPNAYFTSAALASEPAATHAASVSSQPVLALQRWFLRWYTSGLIAL